jgi:HK97 family phage prohead protease
VVGCRCHGGFALLNEIRTFPLVDLEVREADDAPPTIVGHGIVTDSLSLDLGGFREKVDPQAAARAIKRRGAVIKSFFNHNPDHVLGRTDNKTLKLSTDERGVVYAVTPPDTQWARDLLVSVKRGDVKGSSFSFRTLKDRWEEDEGTQTRTLLDFELFEIGPVTEPAYPKADSQVRAMLEARGITLDGEPDEWQGWADALLVTVRRLKSGRPLTDDEAHLRAAIIALEGLLPRQEPPEATTDIPEGEDWQRGAAFRQRTLALLRLIAS